MVELMAVNPSAMYVTPCMCIVPNARKKILTMLKLFSRPIRQISNTRWIRSREYPAYLMLLVWVLGLKRLWPSFERLGKSVMAIWKASGSRFAVGYLKECVHILVCLVASQPYTPAPRGVRVKRSRSGVPLVLPKELRRSFLALRKGANLTRDWTVVRAVLSALSVYRVMGCKPITKLETITGPFSGVGETLAQAEVSHAIALLNTRLVIKPADPWHVSESGGPNYPKATWGSGLDALALLRNPREAWAWISLAIGTKSWLLLVWLVLVWIASLPAIPWLTFIGKMPRKIGKLVKLHEAAGKVRIVAVTDWWTQALLLPLHNSLYEILRTIRQDGTFDQTAPLQRMLEIRRSKLFSYDLSAATDRLPVLLQVQVLETLGFKGASAWAALLTRRVWWLGQKEVKYAVGQPMGAYSSWAMLALTHHVVVQVAAQRSGWKTWFPYYAVLGDDIVIADENVAKNYYSIMTYLGVTINTSKSLVSESCLEFAKRWVHTDLGEFSPLGAGVLLGCVRNLRMLPMLISELANKDYSFYPELMKELFQGARRLRRNFKDSLALRVSLLGLGPSGGLWKRGQLSNFFEAWLSSFPTNASPDATMQIVHEALLLVAIHKVNRALSSRSEQLRVFIQNWLKYPLLGTSLARVALSAPLMLVAPGLWATVRQLQENPGASFSHGIPGSRIDPETFAKMSRAVMGDISSLRWSERRAVTDFFATQDLLLEMVKEVRYTTSTLQNPSRCLGVIPRPTFALTKVTA